MTIELVNADPAPKLKVPRQPKQDYGFKKEAVITLTGKETKYRGARKSWFDSVSSMQGQTVASYLEAYKDSKESPRGWLRFFVQDGAVSLVAAS